MKYRDPESGKVFDTIEDARRKYCDSKSPSYCAKCPLSIVNNKSGDQCMNFTNRYPTETARLMGYEVIKEEEPMNKQGKPRICEVLGVEVDEQFTIKDSALICNYFHGREMYIDRFGDFRIADPKPRKGDYVSSEEKMKDIFVLLQHAINYPECIVRRKRFTEQEIEDAKALKRLVACSNGICRENDGLVYILRNITSGPTLKTETFPSIAPGKSYTLDEIIGEGTE